MNRQISMFRSFLVVGTLLWGMAAYASDCVKITAFNGQCSQPNAPRQFQCSVSAQALQPGVKLRLVPMNGTFNGQPFFEAPIQNGAAQFALGYTEGQFSPSITFQAQVIDAQNNPICRTFVEQPLPACGSDCSQATGTIVLSGNSGLYSNQITPSHAKPGISFVGALANVPTTAPKVKSITVEMLKAERREVCPQGPANTPWRPVLLAPLMPQHTGWPASSYSVPNTKTAILNVDQKLNGGMDWGFPFYAPEQKLNAKCGEVYRADLRITVTFENGCSISQTFNQVSINRP